MCAWTRPVSESSKATQEDLAEQQEVVRSSCSTPACSLGCSGPEGKYEPVSKQHSYTSWSLGLEAADLEQYGQLGQQLKSDVQRA